METRHIKLNYEEAIFLKKQILLAELNLLGTAKKVRNYKMLRKKELASKTKLKTALKILKGKIKLLQSTIPKEDIPKAPKKRTKRIEKVEHDTLQSQLEEIKEKLSRLE